MVKAYLCHRHRPAILWAMSGIMTLAMQKIDDMEHITYCIEKCVIGK